MKENVLLLLFQTEITWRAALVIISTYMYSGKINKIKKQTIKPCFTWYVFLAAEPASRSSMLLHFNFKTNPASTPIWLPSGKNQIISYDVWHSVELWTHLLDFGTLFLQWPNTLYTFSPLSPFLSSYSSPLWICWVHQVFWKIKQKMFAITNCCSYKRWKIINAILPQALVKTEIIDCFRTQTAMKLSFPSSLKLVSSVVEKPYVHVD